ncbi:flagella basal body P-ring formation protein FlgA [Lysobacter sp. 2RAF19]
MRPAVLAHRPFRFAVAVLLVASAARVPAATPDVQSLDAIRAAAIQALGGNARPADALLDSALRLAPCTQALKAAATGPRTVQVRCEDTPGWQIYVHVRMPREAMPNPVLASEPQFAPLRRGDPVVILARTEGIEVRMDGRALGPAQAGGRVVVENTASHRVLRGRVVADGVVEVVP